MTAKPDSATKARRLLGTDPERAVPEKVAAAQVLATLAVAEAIDRAVEGDVAPKAKRGT